VPPKKKEGKIKNSHFPAENLWMANKHVQRCPASLLIHEMQIKITEPYPYILTRMAVTKKTDNIARLCWD
jgi:hypothetical protein